MTHNVGSRHRFAVWDSHLPPEFYGRMRDEVKLLTVDRQTGVYSSANFTDVHRFLRPGDVLVFNNSALVPSSIAVFDHASGLVGALNFGTSRSDGMVLVEPRPKSLNHVLGDGPREMTMLGSGLTVRLESRHDVFKRFFWADTGLGDAALRHVMQRFGSALTYDHIPFKLPLEYYTSIFSHVPGSSEFPSAARPFSPRVMKPIEGMGIGITQVTLHCNLSPLEPSEFDGVPFLLDEQYEITPAAAETINAARSRGGRIIAVGTSVVRALESTYSSGTRPGSGVTDLFIRPGYELRAVDGLLTGMHDPESSHIEMVSSFLDDSVLRSAYSTAQSLGYQWHEFGDISLIA